MSTGADCTFLEVEPGRWKYRLQQWPFGESESYETYGPFASFATAREHLSREHANPGGWSVVCLPDGVHRHEFSREEGRDGVIGKTVQIEVRSLGADASDDEVIAYIQSLPRDHGAWNVRPSYGWIDGEFMACEPCGQVKEEVPVG